MIDILVSSKTRKLFANCPFSIGQPCQRRRCPTKKSKMACMSLVIDSHELPAECLKADSKWIANSKLLSRFLAVLEMLSARKKKKKKKKRKRKGLHYCGQSGQDPGLLTDPKVVDASWTKLGQCNPFPSSQNSVICRSVWECLGLILQALWTYITGTNLHIVKRRSWQQFG